MYMYSCTIMLLHIIHVFSSLSYKRGRHWHTKINMYLPTIYLPRTCIKMTKVKVNISACKKAPVYMYVIDV